MKKKITMKVLKFGGTSIGDANQIKKVVKLISNTNTKIVVLSAFSGVTNSLSEFIKQLNKKNWIVSEEIIQDLEERHLSLSFDLLSSTKFRKIAKRKILESINTLSRYQGQNISQNDEYIILSQGESLSAMLIYLYSLEQDIDMVYIPALNFMKICKNGEPDYEFIKLALENEINKYNDCKLFITNGFICLNNEKQISNLGRGGSDFTATIIGRVLNSNLVEIWTDIDGLQNNDPRFVENTKAISNLSYEQAAELAYFGAKILHPASISPVQNQNIPILLKNTFNSENKGTLISNYSIIKELKAIAAKDCITTIKIKSGHMMQAYGFLRKIFEVFEKYKTSVDMLTTSEISVAMTIENNCNLNQIIEELSAFGETQIEEHQCIISIVGDYSKKQNISIQNIIDCLHSIPIKMISFGASKINISFVIDSENKIEALNLLNNYIHSNEPCLAIEK